MFSKSAILFERATIVALDFSSRAQPFPLKYFTGPSRVRYIEYIESRNIELDAGYNALLGFDQQIEKFYSTIAPVTPNITSTRSIRELIIVRSLTLGAIINLNSVRAEQDGSCNQRCVSSAIAMVTLFDDIDIHGLGYLGPIMGVSVHLINPRHVLCTNTYEQNLWRRAGQVLICECLHLRGYRDPASPLSFREESLRRTLHRLIAVMEPFSRTSPYISEWFFSYPPDSIERLTMYPQVLSVLLFYRKPGKV
jgi:hypothetical protein